METVPSSRWQTVRRWLPGILISAAALFIVLRMIRWQDLKQALASFNPLYVGIAVVLTILFLITRGFASRTLLEDRVSFKQAFLTINIGYLLNNLFPLRAGELGRAVILGQSSGLGPMHVLSTIVIERAFDLAIAAGLLLSTLPLALGMAQARPVAIVILILMIAMLAVLFLMARNQELVHRWAGWVGKRIPLVQKYLVPQMDALLRGLAVLVQPKRFLVALWWVVASWIIAVVEYYVMLLSLNPNPPFWWGAFVDSVLALGIAVPSAPGAVGVFEAAMVGALTILKFTPEQGLAYAVILHFMQWILTAAFGIYGLASQGQSIGSYFHELRARMSARKTNETDQNGV